MEMPEVRLFWLKWLKSREKSEVRRRASARDHPSTGSGTRRHFQEETTVLRLAKSLCTINIGSRVPELAEARNVVFIETPIPEKPEKGRKT